MTTGQLPDPRRRAAPAKPVRLPHENFVEHPAPLRLAACSLEAARYAVTRWHYSRSLPVGRMVRLGCWERGRFVGVVIFARGASSEIHSPFGLRQDQVCELCRVALGPHEAPTSRIVALAVRLLRQDNPGLRLVVSYADPEHQHIGTLYQAMGWRYLGQTHRESLIRLNGQLRHPRSVTSRYRTRAIPWLREHVDPDAGHVRTRPKYRYALPLDAAMRDQLSPRVQPYPKRDRSADSGTPAPSGRGSCDGTRSLHSEATHG